MAQFARVRASGRKFVAIEDGGYLTPILNDASLSGLTPSQFRAQHSAPAEPATDARLSPTITGLLTENMIGSVEHTRSGYDNNMRTYLAHGKLAVPVFTIAISYLKTQIESDSVSATILNAIECVLYSQGIVLGRRNVFVFGSRGNIGRRIMTQLRTRLDRPDNAVIGCDLKVSRPDTQKQLPEWQLRPSQSSAGGASEVTTYVEVDAARASDIDLIIGVTGGPTTGHPVFQVDDLVRWLLQGHRTELYLVSGSTKTDEFPEVLAWIKSIFAQSEGTTGEFIVDLKGKQAHVWTSELTDALSHRVYGSKYTFSVPQDGGTFRECSVVFVAGLTPVNFLFYGVPTEIIDVVLAQLLSASLALLREHTSLPERRMYAVDYDPQATNGVYAGHQPCVAKGIPLPGPTE